MLRERFRFSHDKIIVNDIPKYFSFILTGENAVDRCFYFCNLYNQSNIETVLWDNSVKGLKNIYNTIVYLSPTSKLVCISGKFCTVTLNEYCCLNRTHFVYTFINLGIFIENNIMQSSRLRFEIICEIFTFVL